MTGMRFVTSEKRIVFGNVLTSFLPLFETKFCVFQSEKVYFLLDLQVINIEFYSKEVTLIKTFSTKAKLGLDIIKPGLIKNK